MNILDFLAKWEPLWLFLILAVEMIVGIYTAVVVKKEKSQKRTKTTKKTTTSAAGQSTVEESTEVIEPIETKEGTNA